MEENNANYRELLKCPQNPYLMWRIEDATGVCAENEPDHVDWHFSDVYNVQYGLGYVLQTSAHSGKYWICPWAGNGCQGCGIATNGNEWHDTTEIRAYQSNGNITVYFSGKK